MGRWITSAMLVGELQGLTLREEIKHYAKFNNKVGK